MESDTIYYVMCIPSLSFRWYKSIGLIDSNKVIGYFVQHKVVYLASCLPSVLHSSLLSMLSMCVMLWCLLQINQAPLR